MCTSLSQFGCNRTHTATTHTQQHIIVRQPAAQYQWGEQRGCQRQQRPRCGKKEYFEWKKKNLLFVLDVHESVHRDTTMKVTKKMQLCRLIYYPWSALHVSSKIFTHHQKHLTVFTVSGSIHPSSCRLVSWMSWNWTELIQDTSQQLLGWILPDTVNTVKCSWWWAKTLPKKWCRAD